MNRWRSFPIGIYGTAADSLYYVNVVDNQNDKQWSNLIDYFPDDFKKWEQEYDKKNN